MKVVILCGGYGTRIRDVSENIPKPMIPIGDKPIIWHIMKYYSLFGFKDFVLCLGYKGDSIRSFFSSYWMNQTDYTITLGKGFPVKYDLEFAESDWNITFAETGLDTMTGGRVRKIKKYVDHEEDFMLTYGDGVGDIDLNALIEFHRSHGKILTITGVHPPGRFGVLENNLAGLVTEFNEKPQSQQGLISGGFFVCNTKIFDHLSDDENLVFEQAPMKNLVSLRQMMVYVHDGFWQPMDTSREFRLLNQMYNEKSAPWVVW